MYVNKAKVGTLSRLNVETLERASTPLFGETKVRCSAHGRTFARVRYTLDLWYVVDFDTFCLVITHSDRCVTAAVTSSVLPPSNEVKPWMQSMYEAAD